MLLSEIDSSSLLLNYLTSTSEIFRLQKTNMFISMTKYLTSLGKNCSDIVYLQLPKKKRKNAWGSRKKLSHYIDAPFKNRQQQVQREKNNLIF